MPSWKTQLRKNGTPDTQDIHWGFDAIVALSSVAVLLLGAIVTSAVNQSKISTLTDALNRHIDWAERKTTEYVPRTEFDLYRHERELNGSPKKSHSNP